MGPDGGGHGAKGAYGRAPPYGRSIGQVVSCLRTSLVPPFLIGSSHAKLGRQADLFPHGPNQVPRVALLLVDGPVLFGASRGHEARRGHRGTETGCPDG